MLLTRCVRRIGTVSPVASDIVRGLLIADRYYLVLKLREATFGAQVQATVQCPWETCREKVDIDFSLHDIPVRESEEKGPLYTRELSPEAAFSSERGEQYREVVFRLPNGEDQEAISPVVEENEAKALALLLTRCLRRLGSLHDPGLAVIHRLSPRPCGNRTTHGRSRPASRLDLAAHCPV
jgi:hypothetical protein